MNGHLSVFHHEDLSKATTLGALLRLLAPACHQKSGSGELLVRRMMMSPHWVEATLSIIPSATVKAFELVARVVAVPLAMSVVVRVVAFPLVAMVVVSPVAFPLAVG